MGVAMRQQLSLYWRRMVGQQPAASLATFAENGWLARGQAAMRAQDYPAALRCFDKAVKGEPTSHGAWYGRGMALYHMGHDEAALQAFTRASQYQPQSHLAW